MSKEKEAQLKRLYKRHNEIDGWITHMSLEDRASGEQDKLARELNRELTSIKRKIEKINNGEIT